MKVARRTAHENSGYKEDKIRMNLNGRYKRSVNEKKYY